MINTLRVKAGFMTLYNLKDFYKETILAYHNLNQDIPTSLLINASKLEKYLKQEEAAQTAANETSKDDFNGPEGYARDGTKYN